MPNLPTGAADLLRAVGLMADGPVTWGRPVPSRRPGVYLVEWPDALPDAPVELTLVGKWLERLPGLRLDGNRPTTRELATRLHDFWLPGQTVVYVGASPTSVGGRVGGFYRTPLGDRKPHPSGHWLKTLRNIERARIWWAETDAPEEYEDALLSAFAERVDASTTGAPRLPDRSIVLPFGNLRSVTGARKAHGITGAMEAEPAQQPAPGTKVTVLPDGIADGVEERPVAAVGKAAAVGKGAAVARAVTQAEVSSARPANGVAALVDASNPAADRILRSSQVQATLGAINDTLQALACGSLMREISVAEAATELGSKRLLRGGAAAPVGPLRELLKQGVIEGGVQDADRRWSIRCVRRGL